MAGDWMQIDLDLAEKPEVLLLKANTGMGTEAVVGPLVAFWRWVEKNAVDGFVPHANASVVGDVVNAEPKFVETLIKVNWLLLDDRGASIPGWEKRFSKAAKQRIADAKRKSTGRLSESSGQKPDKPRTDTGAKEEGEGEKEEERKKKRGSAPQPPAVELPPILDTPLFHIALESWKIYKGKSYKQRGLKALLSQAAKRAEEHGVEAVIAALEKAQANNWAGWDFESSFTSARGSPRSPTKHLTAQQYQPNSEIADGF